MRVCFFVPRIENCGPVNVVMNLLKEFVKCHNVEVTIVAVRGSLARNDYARLMEEVGAWSVTSLEGLSFLEKIKKLNILVESIDIIHSHGFYPDLFVSLLKTGRVKKISTIHCFLFSDYIKEYGEIKGRIAGALHHLILGGKAFHSVIACSESVKRYLLQKSIRKNGNIEAVCNGVDQDVFYPLSLKEKQRKKVDFLELKREVSLYIYSGRLIRRKKVPELIKLFSEKMDRGSDVLLVLGDGAEIDECKKAAEKNENIRFLGFVSDPVPYYQMADYAVSNSSAEGYPMSIIEALSCGTLAYLSDIEPHNELMKKYPNLVFPLDNIQNKVSFNEDFYKDVKFLSSKKMAEEYYDIYAR